MNAMCSTNRVNRTLTSFALLSCLCICSCHSQQPKNPSLGQLIAKAQKGDSEAQYQLALLYERGSPEAAKDSAKAIQWFRVLADKGDRRGENAVGIAYLHGYGVTEDDTTGFEWFYKAAVKGYPAAQFNLAGTYYRGRGTPKNGKEAFNWFVEAARNGEPSAQQMLCAQYQAGLLVDADPTIAYAWCLIAQTGQQKHPEVLYKYLSKAAALSSTQVQEARTLASSWIANHRMGGAMPLHSRSFLSSARSDITDATVMPPDLRLPTQKKSYARINGCESGHWVDSVLSDGEVVKLEDGSVWQIDSGDTVDSSSWLETDDVTVCDGKLVDTDDHSSVGAHRLK
jgi:hypothetical protein